MVKYGRVRVKVDIECPIQTFWGESGHIVEYRHKWERLNMHFRICRVKMALSKELELICLWPHRLFVKGSVTSDNE